ncbi:MAG: DUF2911 domain-containing protein [Pyrinomonadaceae bacterium]|nr:DUF2911 domain-containing protein [Pyrinomonadaceae bacterium]
MKNFNLFTRKYFAAIAFIFVAFSSYSLSQNVTTPRNASPAAQLKQRIGLTDITVKYSRPKITLRGNDRTGKIWGQLVPYGLQKVNFPKPQEIPWRAGANENTTIHFSTDVAVEGKTLPAGKYGLHMIIHDPTKATVIFSKNHTSWGSFFYDQSEDALRVDVTTATIPKTELLTFSFINYGNNYGVLALDWEMKRIPFKIEIDAHKTILASYRNELRSIPGFGWRGWATAASYCLNNRTNLVEGLQWANNAVGRNKNFQTLGTRAGLNFLNGKTGDGNKDIDEAIPLGNKNQLNQMGYTYLNAKFYPTAIKIFEANAAKNPTDPNMFDSLGEAYKISGDKANAIKNLKKALSMNPPANVKANSEKLLKELGAL